MRTTITRYDVTADKKFTVAGKVSFQSLGVTRLQHRNVFESADKAYYIDNSQGQIIIWNPLTMSVEKTVKLPAEATEGFQGFRVIFPYYQLPLIQGKIFIPVSWLNSDEGKTRDLTGLVVFDTTTEAVTYSETDRCPSATELAFADNGDVYYGTNVNQPFYGNAADAAKRATARTSCILRVAAGQTAFDPSFTLKLADLAGGCVGMSLANAAAPGFGYVQVLNETVTPWTSITDEDSYWESAAWEWWLVDLAKGTATVDKNLPAGAPFIKTFEVDKSRYVVQQKGDDKSQIFLLSPDGNHKPGLTATGEIEGIARVR